MEAASKYQMTARALKMSSTGSTKGRVHVLPVPGQGPVNNDVDETADIVDDFEQIAVQAAASQTVEQTPRTTTGAGEAAVMPAQAQASSSSRSLVTSDKDGAEEEETDTVDDMQSVFRRSLDSAGGLSRITEVSREHMHEEHDAFWMPELAKAVENKDQASINAAVVRDFLQIHDPERVGEAEELLKAHAGKEDQLMDALIQQYDEVILISVESSSPRNSDLTSMSLKVDLSSPDGPRVTAAAASTGGGFILSGVKKADTWIVNSNNPDQTNLLRSRMLAKGLKADMVESVVGDVSEML